MILIYMDVTSLQLSVKSSWIAGCRLTCLQSLEDHLSTTLLPYSRREGVRFRRPFEDTPLPGSHVVFGVHVED